MAPVASYKWSRAMLDRRFEIPGWVPIDLVVFLIAMLIFGVMLGVTTRKINERRDAKRAAKKAARQSELGWPLQPKYTAVSVASRFRV